MIPSDIEFELRTVEKDRLGKIIGPGISTFFWGVIDESTVYSNSGGQLVALGKGTIFTSDCVIVPVEGQKIYINTTEEYVVKKVHKLYVHGVFHHFELVYE